MPVIGTGPTFDILPPRGDGTPVVGHVPHAWTVIPEEVRREILLEDPALEQELVRLTDWHTDDLYDSLRDDGASLFVNRLSRLVFDPERFPDDAAEPMAAVGQGAVYTRTSSGDPLRELSASERARRIAELFEPYHAALTDLVRSQLERFGRCTIVDGHSFSSRPLPAEPDQRPDRPEICIGTDAFHTPPSLAEAFEAAFVAEGFIVRRDAPFTGCLVPLAFYGKDARVSSVMVEIRRDLYCDESSGARLATYPQVRAAIGRAMRAALAVREANAGWR